MRNSNELFKKSLDSAFAGMKMDSSTALDAQKLKSSFKEETEELSDESISNLFSVSKKENKEATGTGSSGSYSAPLLSGEEPDLEKIEAKEATSSSSVGSYVTTDAWAKSMKPKDWRGKSKTQIPGGSFVTVKDKCKKFPYCNQGDIKALNIYKNKKIKEAIENVSKDLNISETTIKAILQYEIESQIKNK